MADKEKIVVIGDGGPMRIGLDEAARLLETAQDKINKRPDSDEIMDQAQKAGAKNDEGPGLH